MADVTEYPDIIKRILREYAVFRPSHGQIDVETVFDDAGGHYELVHTGWDKTQRVHGSVIHIDLRGDKVWVQFDGTEYGVTNDLLEAGIPEKSIVLAFHHPSERQYAGFAVG